MSMRNRVVLQITTIVAVLGIAILLGKVVAEDAIYWLDSDYETCSQDNDSSDCPDTVAANDPGGVTCLSGDHYLNAYLDVFAEGGSNTQWEEKIPVDCSKPVTCTKMVYYNTEWLILPTTSACGLKWAPTDCYNCSHTLGDPETEDSDLLGDCAEE